MSQAYERKVGILMKSRLIPMLITGLALALGMLAAMQLMQSLRAAKGTDIFSDEFSQQQDLNKTVTPIIFQTISEQDDQLSLSGTSEAEARISLYHQSQKLLEMVADNNGKWSASFPVKKDQHLALDLIIDVDQGARIRSDETVYRIPYANVGNSGETTQDFLKHSQQERALLLVTAPGGPSKVTQTPFRGPPKSGDLSLGAIDYDNSGGVIFSGNATSGGLVRIFANDGFIGESQVAPDGRWFLIAPETLPLGEYDIKAEFIQDNELISELSQSFTRFVDKKDFLQFNENLFVNYTPYGWYVARTLYGGGEQLTAILAPLDADLDIPKN